MRLPGWISVFAQSVTDWKDSWASLAVVCIAWLLAQVTVVLGPPATFGLYAVARRLANGENVGLTGLIEGARENFGKSWLWAALNLFVFGGLYINFFFYGSLTQAWAPYVQIFVLALALYWLAIQFYALPYSFEYGPSIRLSIKNAFFTVMASWPFTLALMFLATLVALSAALVIPIFLGVPVIIPLMGFHAIRNRLEAFGLREREKSPREIEQEQSSRAVLPPEPKE